MDEWVNFLHNRLGMNKRTAKNVFGTVDADNSGTISYDEFEGWFETLNKK